MGYSAASLRRSLALQGQSRLVIIRTRKRVTHEEKKKNAHTEVLMHGIGVICPRQEIILVGSELLLHGFDVCWVFVEEDLGID